MATDNMPQEPDAAADQPPILYKEEEKQLAMACHASALVGVLMIGLGMWICPLLLWVLRKDTSAVVAYHAKEALNFQLNVLAVIFLPLVFGLMLSNAVPFLATIFLMVYAAGVLYGGAMAVIVGIKASDGTNMRYPTVIKVIR